MPRPPLPPTLPFPPFSTCLWPFAARLSRTDTELWVDPKCIHCQTIRLGWEVGKAGGGAASSVFIISKLFRLVQNCQRKWCECCGTLSKLIKYYKILSDSIVTMVLLYLFIYYISILNIYYCIYYITYILLYILYNIYIIVYIIFVNIIR